MNPDHIDGPRGEFCLCDDCTQGYRLVTPRVRDSKDVEYALVKMRKEVSGTDAWSDADHAAARWAVSTQASGYSGAVRSSSTRVMISVVPVCCPMCGCQGNAPGHIWPLGGARWECTHCGEFISIAAVGRE